MQRLFITALALLPFLFTSCNPDEELIDNGDMFIGTWKLNGYESANGIFAIEDDSCISQNNFIIDSDGDLIITQYYWANEIPNTNCLHYVSIELCDIINESLINFMIADMSFPNGYMTTVGEIYDEGVMKVQVLDNGQFQGNYSIWEKIN